MAAPAGLDKLRPPPGASVRRDAQAPIEDASPAAAAGPPSGATAQALLGMLRPAFGGAIAHSVLKALEHDLRDPRPLAQQEIDATISAAETSRMAMSGLSFLSRTLVTAQGGGAAFDACAAAAGVDPATLSDETRARIDGAFALELATAGSDRQGVDLRAALPLMQRAIGAVLSRTC